MFRNWLTKTLGAAALLGLVVWPGISSAGTLDAMPDEAWAKPLTNEEMSELRGGFRGISFSAFLTASIENRTGDLSGSFDTAPPPSVTLEGNTASVQTVIGNFVGTTGIVQAIQVPGSFNIVNNNLFVQIVIQNGLEASSPSFLGF